MIQEIGYSFSADVWGLGITIIEFVEMVPPRANLHPMKVLLKIPILPAPELEFPEMYSPEMSNFLEISLKKSPALRSTAEQLSQHKWLEKKNINSAKVADLVTQGLELISKFKSREAAMKSRK